VREGLTNAIKHAPGARVTVALELHAHELRIEIHDTGSADAGRLVDTGAGLGLTGMRERVELTGGSLKAGPEADGGWTLQASLPLSSPTLTPAQ
jgi:signal transduction histidine kinase